jgi:hypothetical protein
VQPRSLADDAATIADREVAVACRKDRFYEAHRFRAVECTDGRNEENEPDVKYECF